MGMKGGSTNHSFISREFYDENNDNLEFTIDDFNITLEKEFRFNKKVLIPIGK
jgi:hypothetical protein